MLCTSILIIPHISCVGRACAHAHWRAQSAPVLTPVAYTCRYTRAQTVMVLLNSLALEVTVLCLMYSRPSDGPLVINPVAVVVSGTFAALVSPHGPHACTSHRPHAPHPRSLTGSACLVRQICIPAMVTFAWVYDPIIFYRVAKWLVRQIVLSPCHLSRSLGKCFCWCRRHGPRRCVTLLCLPCLAFQKRVEARAAPDAGEAGCDEAQRPSPGIESSAVAPAPVMSSVRSSLTSSKAAKARSTGKARLSWCSSTAAAAAAAAPAAAPAAAGAAASAPASAASSCRHVNSAPSAAPATAELPTDCEVGGSPPPPVVGAPVHMATSVQVVGVLPLGASAAVGTLVHPRTRYTSDGLAAEESSRNPSTCNSVTSVVTAPMGERQMVRITTTITEVVAFGADSANESADETGDENAEVVEAPAWTPRWNPTDIEDCSSNHDSPYVRSRRDGSSGSGIHDASGLHHAASVLLQGGFCNSGPYRVPGQCKDGSSSGRQEEVAATALQASWRRAQCKQTFRQGRAEEQAAERLQGLFRARIAHRRVAEARQRCTEARAARSIFRALRNHHGLNAFFANPIAPPPAMPVYVSSRIAPVRRPSGPMPHLHLGSQAPPSPTPSPPTNSITSLIRDVESSARPVSCTHRAADTDGPTTIASRRVSFATAAASSTAKAATANHAAPLARQSTARRSLTRSVTSSSLTTGGRRLSSMLRRAVSSVGASRSYSYASLNDHMLKQSLTRSWHKRDWPSVGRILFGWGCNLLAFFGLCLTYSLYACELFSSREGLSPGGSSEAMLFSWGISIFQRFVVNEPLLILLSKGLPMLFTTAFCANVCGESVVNIFGLIVEGIITCIKQIKTG